jgi:hypothetical protein
MDRPGLRVGQVVQEAQRSAAVPMLVPTDKI